MDSWIEVELFAKVIDIHPDVPHLGQPYLARRVNIQVDVFQFAETWDVTFEFKAPLCKSVKAGCSTCYVKGEHVLIFLDKMHCFVMDRTIGAE